MPIVTSTYRYKRLPRRRLLANALMGMALIERGMDGVLACGGTGARPARIHTRASSRQPVQGW